MTNITRYSLVRNNDLIIWRAFSVCLTDSTTILWSKSYTSEFFWSIQDILPSQEYQHKPVPMKIASIKIKDSSQVFNLVAMELFYLTHSEQLNFSGRKQLITILKCIPNLSNFMFFATVLFIQILIIMQLNNFGR